MFVLQPKPTFKAEVLIPIPGGAEGKIKFEFKHMGKKALKEFFDGLGLGEGETPRADEDVIPELVVGWEGVDEKFSKDALLVLLDSYPLAATNIFGAYHKGLQEGKQKN